MNELRVRCANTERGCQWTGTVGTSDPHKASCQFALVPSIKEDKGTNHDLFSQENFPCREIRKGLQWQCQFVTFSQVTSHCR